MKSYRKGRAREKFVLWLGFIYILQRLAGEGRMLGTTHTPDLAAAQ